MQWPVKARGCQHLSFPNHDIGNQILAMDPRKGGKKGSRQRIAVRWAMFCFVLGQAGKTERRDGGIV